MNESASAGIDGLKSWQSSMKFLICIILLHVITQPSPVHQEVSLALVTAPTASRPRPEKLACSWHMRRLHYKWAKGALFQSDPRPFLITLFPVQAH